MCLASQQGFQNTVLALGNLAEQVQEYFDDGRQLGLRIEYAVEDQPLGTAGAIKNATPYLDDTFLVLNGDIFMDINLEELLSLHQRSRALVTIATVVVTNPMDYGLVEADSRGRIRNFIEKPEPDQVTTNLINAGIYIMEPEILRWIPEQGPYSLEKQVFPQLLAEGYPIFAHQSQCYWMDIGTPERYLKLNYDLLTMTLAHYHIAPDTNYGAASHPLTAQGIKVIGPVMVGANTIIENGTVLKGPLVIGQECIIKREAVISESVIWEAVQVGASTHIEQSVIANHCLIGEYSQLSKTVIGDHISLPDSYQSEPGNYIWP